MADYEPLRPRRGGASNNSTSAIHFLRKNAWLVAAGAWVILSIYPVFVFFFPGEAETLVGYDPDVLEPC